MTATDPTGSLQVPASVRSADPRYVQRNLARASGRMLGLVIGLAAGGLGWGGFWKPRQTDRIVISAVPVASGLSSETLALLQSLDAPVQIEFYAPLDTATVQEDVTRFAARASILLAAYANASGGRLSVVELRSRADAPNAAAAGMKPFNLNRGDVCYLGLKVVQGGRSELLPRLNPAWEQALEADISRAIARVLVPIAESLQADTATPVLLASPATMAEVKRQIQNFDAVSLEEGIQILRKAALKEVQSELSQNEGLIKDAAQRVAQMAQAHSETEKQAALKDLQRLQAEQAAKLGEYTTRSTAQIEALRQIKETAR